MHVKYYKTYMLNAADFQCQCYIVQKFDRIELCQMRPTLYFNEQNFDKLIVGIIGETLK